MFREVAKSIDGGSVAVASGILTPFVAIFVFLLNPAGAIPPLPWCSNVGDVVIVLALTVFPAVLFCCVLYHPFFSLSSRRGGPAVMRYSREEPRPGTWSKADRL